jgi:hypothetical protein
VSTEQASGPGPGGEPPLSMRLELDPAAEPISGRIGGQDGTGAVSFRGWLELTAAIGSLLEEARRRAHPVDD